MPQIARLNANVSHSGLTKHTQLKVSIVCANKSEVTPKLSVVFPKVLKQQEKKPIEEHTPSRTNELQWDVQSIHWLICVGGIINVWDKELTVWSVCYHANYTTALLTLLLFLTVIQQLHSYSREDADVRYDAYMCNIMLFGYAPLYFYKSV